MLSKFFLTQWKYPCNSKEWTEQVRIDLDDFDIPVDLNFIKSKSEYSFKNMVKVKAKEYCFMKMMEKKIGHSKMDDVLYTIVKAPRDTLHIHCAWCLVKCNLSLDFLPAITYHT